MEVDLAHAQEECAGISLPEMPGVKIHFSGQGEHDGWLVEFTEGDDPEVRRFFERNTPEGFHLLCARKVWLRPA